MSYLTSVNWALFWQRVIWTSVWVVAMTITFWLCRDMAQSHPAIYALLVLCAVGESIGLAYVRRHWMQGNIGSSGFAAAITMLCMGLLLFSELSFWSGSIEGINEQVSREHAIQEGKDLVFANRKERYAILTSGSTPEQIQSQVDIKKLDPIYGRTANCTNATVPESRAFCAEIFALSSQLASAKEARSLEGTVFGAGTIEETLIKRNFYRGAEVAAYWTGWDPQFWVNTLVLFFVVALQALRVGPLFIGWAPEKRREAVTVAMATPAPRTCRDPLEALSGAARLPAAPSAPLWQTTPQTNSSVTPAPEPEKPTPDPDGGEKIPEPEVAKASLPEPSNVVKLRETIEDSFPLRGRTNKKKRGRKEGDVKSWLGSCTDQTDNPSVVSTIDECRKSYVAWCMENGFDMVHKKVMSRQIRALVGKPMPKGQRGPRNGKGAIFPGLIVYMPQVEKKAARA